MIKILERIENIDDIEQYDENEEYYEEQLDFEEEQPNKQKSAFRFPLISDSEVMPQQRKQERVSRVEQSSLSPEERPLELPKYLQHSTSKVYDVQAQGIRDLLEHRQKRTGHSTVLRRPKTERRTLSVTKDEKEFLTKKPIREEKPVNKEFVNPFENRKRFVPTEVPSPVHGFKKPKHIQELVADKQKEVAEKVAEELASTPLPVTDEATNKAAQTAVANESLQQVKLQVEKSSLAETDNTSQSVELIVEAVEEEKKIVEVNPTLYENNDSLIIAEEAEEQDGANETPEDQFSDVRREGF